MSTTRNRACVDCKKPCTGRRCRQCEACNRVGKPRGVADPGPRVRPKELNTRELYPLPTPSPDTSPLKLHEIAQAECTGTARDICFPEDAGIIEAKMLCYRCPIRERCLAVALERNEVHGIWAGSTPAERRTILARRRKEGATT